MKRLCLLLVLPALALGIYDAKWFEPNRWRAPFYNDGRWGIDVSVGGGIAGGSWPQPLQNFYVFGSGLWFGCIVDGDTLVSTSYDPNSGGTEFGPTLCRYWRQGVGEPLDRIYVYPGDWPPPLARFPMAPQQPLSDMDFWTCCGDSDPANHDSTDRPLGIDICVTSYAFSDSLARDMFFLRYDVINASGNPMQGAYVGLVLDGDVGSGTDDRMGLILDHTFAVGPDTFRVRNTGFICDHDNHEYAGSIWEGGVPGAVAVRLLQASGNNGLTAFKSFTIDVDPLADEARYATLAGYNYQTGAYEPYDSIDAGPADKRVLLCSGPFDIAPDSTATVWYAIVAAAFGLEYQVFPNRDTSELARRCWEAEQVFARLTGIAEKPPAEVQPAIRVYPSILSTRSPLHVVAPELTAVRIYDSRGGLVAALAGRDLTWNGTGSDGRALPAGVYLIDTGSRNMTKVILLRE